MDVINGVVKTVARGLAADLIIKDLSSNSRHLLELDGLLRMKLGKIDIYSFYELLPLSPLKSPVVERHSALLNIPSEVEQIGLDADHRAMCRPVDRNDFIYETIAQRIMSIMNRQLDKTQYSKDLTDMTNALASRQIEHISILTKDLHESAAGVNMPPMFSSFIQQSLNLHMSDQAALQHEHGLEEILKSLPTHKMKGFVESVQSIMKRANSLTDLLLLVERQNDQRRAEARMALERQANEARIQQLVEENARLKEALRRRRSRSPPPLGRSRNRHNWTGRYEDELTNTRYRREPSSSQRLSCSRSRSRSRSRTGADISSGGSRENDLLEVSNHGSSLPVEYCAAPMTEAMTKLHPINSDPELSVFEDINSSIQTTQNPIIPTEVVSGGLVYYNRSHQENGSPKDQPLNASFDASPVYCDWNKSPLFAANDDGSEWLSLFPENTTATTVSEARTPWNKSTKEGSDLERQASGTLLAAPDRDAAFIGASLDTGKDDIIVKEDDEWFNGNFVSDIAANQHSATSHVGPEDACSLSLTDAQKDHFGLNSYSSDPIVQDSSCAAAALPIEKQGSNDIKLNASEECIVAPCEQYPNVELDCAVDTARVSRRSPLSIPFRLVKIVFVALRPPAAMIEACKSVSLGRASSSMLARLSTGRPEKKTANNRDETEGRAEKARSDVSKYEDKPSSSDEQMHAPDRLKRFGREATAADPKIAANLKLPFVAEKGDDEQAEAKETAVSATGMDEMILFNGPIARSPYSVPTLASMPPRSELPDERKIRSASIWIDAKPGTPVPENFDNSNLIVSRAPDHGESNHCLSSTDEETPNGNQSLTLNYTGQVAQHSSPTHPRATIVTQELRESLKSRDSQGEADDAQGEKIISSRMQMQGLVQKLTGLLEVGQHVMIASQSDRQI